MNPVFRKAYAEDFAPVQMLIFKSALVLQAQHYQVQEIKAALELVVGIEELISAGSFFVAQDKGKIIGCGGWAIDAFDYRKAEVRGFFVDPDFVRKGIATQILVKCENECLLRGIVALQLTATLSGEPFYKKCGFSEFQRFKQNLSNGETFELIEMIKILS
jgi:N-acetylglutamate synthase-like GNAT family acetyltransferase